MESLFTRDVRIERPNGSVLHGVADILSNQKESFTRFKATQHLLVGWSGAGAPGSSSY